MKDSNALNHVLDELFEHKIGDHVVMTAVLVSLQGELDLNGPRKADRYALNEGRLGMPSPVIVVGRRAEQCHGGTQLHYLVTRHVPRSDGSHVLEATWVTGMEIRPFEEARALMFKFVPRKEDK